MDAQRAAPTSEGVNAIGIWMLTCVTMVFAALSEYGMILFIKFWYGTAIANNGFGRNVSEENKRKLFITKSSAIGIFEVKGVNSAQRGDSNVCENDDECTSKKATTKFEFKHVDPKMIDSISLIVFPITFAVFVVSYCFAFLL